MDAPFQKSWSLYGHKISDNDYFQTQRNLQRSMSTRQPKINLEKRFGYSDQNASWSNCHSNFGKPQAQGRPYQFRLNAGIKFRSLTESNLRKHGVNGLQREYQSFRSPKHFNRQPLRQMPEKIVPIWNNIQNSIGQAGPKTEKFLQKGGEKLSKAMQGVRTSINTFSQRFKRSTKRHYKLDNTPSRTPGRTPPHSSRITPGKLYSPFDVNTPRTPNSYMKGPKRLQSGHNHRRHLYGKENIGLCRTPPPLSICENNIRTYRQSWAQFNSPYHPYSQEEIPQYRLDQTFSYGSSASPAHPHWH